jgi:DNA mismatch repair protein MutL
MLDFNQEHSFEVPPLGAGINLKPPEVNVDPEYNPFNTPGSEREQRNKGNWEELFIPGSSRKEKSRELDTGTIVEHEDQQEEESQVVQSGLELEPSSTKQDKSSPFQLRNTFVVAQIKSGLLIMHQQHSSERIKYEIFMNALKNAEVSTQQKLFTQTIDLTPADFLVYKEIENEIKALGFNIRDFGKNSLIIEGIPAEAPLENADRLLENILEQYKDNAQEIKMEHKDNLARSLARNTAVKAGVKLEKIEMTNMIDQLFACEMPYYSPYGHPTVTTLTIDELMNKFENQY